MRSGECWWCQIHPPTNSIGGPRKKVPCLARAKSFQRLQFLQQKNGDMFSMFMPLVDKQPAIDLASLLCVHRVDLVEHVTLPMPCPKNFSPNSNTASDWFTMVSRETNSPRPGLVCTISPENGTCTEFASPYLIIATDTLRLLRKDFDFGIACDRSHPCGQRLGSEFFNINLRLDMNESKSCPSWRGTPFAPIRQPAPYPAEPPRLTSPSPDIDLLFLPSLHLLPSLASSIQRSPVHTVAMVRSQHHPTILLGTNLLLLSGQSLK